MFGELGISVPDPWRTTVSLLLFLGDPGVPPLALPAGCWMASPMVVGAYLKVTWLLSGPVITSDSGRVVLESSGCDSFSPYPYVKPSCTSSSVSMTSLLLEASRSETLQPAGRAPASLSHITWSPCDPCTEIVA